VDEFDSVEIPFESVDELLDALVDVLDVVYLVALVDVAPVLVEPVALALDVLVDVGEDVSVRITSSELLGTFESLVVSVDESLGRVPVTAPPEYTIGEKSVIPAAIKVAFG